MSDDIDDIIGQSISKLEFEEKFTGDVADFIDRNCLNIVERDELLRRLRRKSGALGEFLTAGDVAEELKRMRTHLSSLCRELER